MLIVSWKTSPSVLGTFSSLFFGQIPDFNPLELVELCQNHPQRHPESKIKEAMNQTKKCYPTLKMWNIFPQIIRKRQIRKKTPFFRFHFFGIKFWPFLVMLLILIPTELVELPQNQCVEPPESSKKGKWKWLRKMFRSVIICILFKKNNT